MLTDHTFSDISKSAQLNMNACTVQPKTYWIKCLRLWQKITDDQILFMQSESNYSTIYYVSKQQTIEKIVTSRTLKHWHRLFETAHLIRIHNRFVVNSNRILSIDKMQHKVVLEGDRCVPYSRSRRSLLVRREA